ncbi:RlpA-like double-psi beta-barrel-protein domain-containing protein-containing protein [Auriculariales sp. MPI-PUGE-AT-0066]|nr:RlpA-like double-psi beta-barrel-protein domain-containing protein-containing protein [Auriculariales sp. MPI-PUGE-AT-0066]
MKAIFSLLALAAVPAVIAHNPHNAGFSRRHHHLERAVEEVALPRETGGLFEVDLSNNSTTHELGRRAFTNAKASWYKVGKGACGKTNVPSDFIVALNGAQFGNSYPGPNCFKKIKITYRGVTGIAEIRDKCPGCPYGGLDFSEGLFKHFSSLGAGIIYMQWEFVDGSSSGGGNDDDKPETTKTTKTTAKPTPQTTKTTTTTRKTSTTKHTSSTTKSSSSSDDKGDETKTETETETETSTSTSTSATPTATAPGNGEVLLQAVLQMGELLNAGSRVAQAS